jgi:hypothetical protein
MRNITILTALLAGMLLQAICTASVANPVTLKTNPFMRPTLDDSASYNTNTTANTASAGSMRLRGIMLANNNSLADIDGKIINIGQQVNGYTLIAVKQRHIVLDRNGIQITLSIDSESDSND